jgi:drug/metabolite transporter (DMT)-like permease
MRKRASLARSPSFSLRTFSLGGHQIRQMTHSSLSARQYLILAFVSVSAPLGDALLARGMTHMPPVTIAHPAALIAAVFTPWIAAGIAFLIAFFISYLTALSWADLTFVLPATALGNVIVALLSRFWLHETISLERWAGIVLITLGVGFVAQGPSLTERPQPLEKEPLKEVVLR